MSAKSKPRASHLSAMPALSLGGLPSGDTAAMDRVIAQQETSAALAPVRAIHPVVQDAVDAIVEPRVRDVATAAVAGFRIGDIIDAPIHLLVESVMNARFFYSVADIDSMSTSLQENGQDTPLAAYEEDGKLHVFDGVKRLKGGRSGGLASLRVEIHAKPESAWDVYVRSARMNTERSAQTSLDDAVRWAEMLSNKVVQSQADLAKRLGKSESLVSHTLSINRIPRSIIQMMKDMQTTSNLNVAYEISKLFDEKAEDGRSPEEREEVAKSVVDEIRVDSLGHEKAIALIKRRLGAPRVRSKVDQHKLRCYGQDAVLKVFPSKGQLSFSVSGLSAEQIARLEESIKTITQQSSSSPA